MNLSEGMRRLALLSGVGGTILSSLLSWTQLQTTMRERTEHIRFEQLAIRIGQLGKETQEEYPIYKTIDAGVIGWRVLVRYPQFWSWVSGQTAHQPELPKPRGIDHAKQLPESSASAVPMFDPGGTLRWVPSDSLDKVAASGDQQAVRIVDPYGVERWAPQSRLQALLKAGATLASPDSVQTAISTHNATQVPTLPEEADYDWRTRGIQIRGGETLHPTPTPRAWSYALIAIFPVLGFFVPWAAIRAIGWVLGGFIQSPR